MSELVNGTEQQTVIDNVEQEPVAQEEQDRTIEIPDGKIGISPAEYRSLEGSEGFVPDHYVVVEEKVQEAEDAFEEPNQELTEPMEQSEPVGITDFHGIPVQVIDGKPQVKMKVDGTEQFIDLQRVMDGFNFNEHNQRVAQDLARQRKELEDLQDTFSLIDKFGTPPQKTQDDDDLDDMFGLGDASDSQSSPQGGDAVLREIKSLKAEIASLKKGEPIQEAQVDPAQQAVMQELNLAYTEAKEICEMNGVFFPPESTDGSNPELVAAVKAAAENQGLDPLTIAKSPARLVNILKSKYKRVTGNQKLNPSSTANPPFANSVQKTTPEIPELKKAQAHIAKLRESNMNMDADHGAIDAEIIATQRHIENLSKGT